jgi:hypothetical protein
MKQHPPPFLLLFIFFSIVLNQSNLNLASEISDPVLEIIRNKVDGYLLKGNPTELCKWFDPKEAVRTFLEANSTLGDLITVNGSRQSPIIVQTACFGKGSLGNDLSQYIESRLCAHLAGVHYIAASFLNSEVTQQNHSFYSAFARTVRHPNPVSTDVAFKTIKKICTCGSMCHEWSSGLMHSNMKMASKIFRVAVDSYWKNRKLEKLKSNSSVEEYLDLRKQKSKPMVGRNRILYSSKENRTATRTAQSHEVLSIKKEAIANLILTTLPTVPDVAIHYRCGDNVVTHYGFTPFRVFAKTIPLDSKYVYVLAESPDRNPKLQSVSRCAAIFDALHGYLMDHFPKAIIVILRGHNIFEDLARLTYANTTICSVSTFCLWPAVANTNTVYFPVTKLITKENTSFDYGPSFHWLKAAEDKAIRGILAVQMSEKELVKKLQS